MIVTFSLLSEFQESLLNLDIGQSVDLAELSNADIQHLVFAGHVSELVDGPCSLVKPTVCIRVVGNIVRPLGYHRQVNAVDQFEDMPTPSHKILPRVDIIPDIREPVSPSNEQEFQFLRLGI